MDSKKKAPQTPFWVSFVSGGMAGTIGAVITCPLEVVKTRLQSSSVVRLQPAFEGHLPSNGSPLIRPLRSALGHISGTVGVLRDMALEEGVGSLWKGVGATIVGVIPARAIYFSTYAKGKHLISEWTGRGEGDPLVHLMAAAAAGMTTCTATNPIWLIKTRMQLQSSKPGSTLVYKNSMDCLRKVVRQEGVAGLYKGLAASYIGVAESTLQWVIYEHLKKSIAASKAASGKPPGNNWIEYFGAAAGAKFIAAVLAYPHEVLRTRMRESGSSNIRKYATIKQSVATILREEGVGALYGGMTAHLMRVVPNSAIMFFTYEFLIHSYDRFISK